MNAISGKNVPLDPNAPPSRAEQILKIGQQAEAQKAAQAEASKPKFGQGAAGEFAGNAVRTVGEGLLAPGAAMETLLDKTLGGGKTHTGEDTQETIDASKADHSDTLAGKAGDVAGTVAPYLTGTGEAAATEDVAGFIPKAVQFLAKHAPEVLKNTAIATDQTGDLKEGVETGVGGEAIAGLATPIKGLAKAVTGKLSIPTSATEAKLVQSYQASTPFLKRLGDMLANKSGGPITTDETAFSHGLMGTEGQLGVGAKRAANDVWNKTLKPALSQAKETVNVHSLFDEAEQSIKADNPELSRQKDLLEALQSLREDYKDVGDISMDQLQKLKEGWAKFIPDKAYNGKPIAGAFNDVKDTVSDIAREKLYNTLGPEAKRAYIDYGNLKNLEEIGQKAMTGSKFKGGTGNFLTGLKDMALTPVATIGGHLIYNTARGLKFIGPVGAHYLSDIFTNEPRQ